MNLFVGKEMENIDIKNGLCGLSGGRREWKEWRESSIDIYRDHAKQVTPKKLYNIQEPRLQSVMTFRAG